MSNSYHNLAKYSFSCLIDMEEQTQNLASNLRSYSYQTSKQGFISTAYMLSTFQSFSLHSTGTHNFPLVETWPWATAMSRPRNRSWSICRCLRNPHRHGGEESQEGWGYWSLSSTLETHLVLSQCQRSACQSTGHLCPWRWYSGCLDFGWRPLL